MLTWLTSLITGPIINAAIGAYKAKLAAGNDADRIAADLAAKELDVQRREIEVQSQLKVAQIGHWWEPEKLFAYILAIYFSKLVLWDKVLGSFFGETSSIFNTDPLTGEAIGWATMIMLFYFGTRKLENIARIIRR